MLLTIIIALNINFTDIKEFIYEHKKYNIEKNFKNTEVKLVSSEKIDYNFDMKSIKRQKNTSIETEFTGKLLFDKNLLKFKELKHSNKINNKVFKNKRIKKLENKSFNAKFNNGFISLDTQVSYFDFFTNNLFFWKINKIPESLVVGQVWSEDKKRTIEINKEIFQLSEYNYMKFLGYRNGFKLIKVTYLFNLKNFLNKETKNFGVAEILLEIKGGYIYKTSINIKVMSDTITENIKFNKVIVKTQ